MNFLEKLKEDKKNYQKSNEDELKVLNAFYFSSYKNTFVIKSGSFSGAYLFFIWIGKKVTDVNLVKHEYGHKLQRKKLGFCKYIGKIFIPSFLCHKLMLKNKLPYSYYSLPWEYEADSLGGVKRKNTELFTDKEKLRIRNLIKLFKSEGTK